MNRITNSILFAIFLVLILLSAKIKNLPDKFDPQENVCTQYHLLYTNVGTPVYGHDGKLIAC